MRLSAAVLLLIAAFISCCEVFATAEEFRQIQGDFAHRVHVKERRQLRTASESLDTEDRNFAVKVRRWANADEADDFVLKELSLAGKLGDDLTSHPNYKLFQDFLAQRKVARKEIRMERMIENGVSTDSVWRKYKLWELPEDQRMLSKKFQKYLLYATMYDNMLFTKKGEGLYRPVVYYHGTKEEIFVKARIWAVLNRPDDYVKSLLLLTDVSEASMKASPYYKYYEEFLRLKAKINKDSVPSI